MVSAFHEAARLLLLRVAQGHRALQNLRWRQHGLGMLQAELSEALRVHVWHPRLRVLPVSSFEPGSSFREVHDHRFDLTSAVIVGEIIDVPFHLGSSSAAEYEDSPSCGWRKTKCWEILHAKIQHGVDASGQSTGINHKFLGDVAVALERQEPHWPRYRQGDAYVIPRRKFHTTRLNPEAAGGLAVTVVHRGNFDERSARILGSAEDAAQSGLVPETTVTGALREWVLQEAADALNVLRG